MESGEYDNTVILFLSDHGELLFDHHLYRKVFAIEFLVANALFLLKEVENQNLLLKL